MRNPLKTRQVLLDKDLSQIVDTELSAYISQQSNDLMVKHNQTAQKLATLNFKAMPATANIREFLGQVRADYQGIITHIEKTLSGGLQKVKGQGHISKAGEDEQDINRKIEAIDIKLTPLKGKFDASGKRHGPEVRNYFYLMIPVLTLIAGVELIANFDVFASLGGNALSSIATAVIALIITFGYAHFIPGKIREYAPKSAKKRLFLFVLSIIPIGVLYYEFSRRRIEHLLALNPDLEGVISSSPWVFCIINVLAYIISCWIIWAYKPSKQTLLEYKKYRNDKKEIDELEAEREGLCQQRANLPAELRGKLTKHYNVLLLGKQHEEEVVTRYHRCFEEMKMELYMRTNGACAPLFTGDIQQDLPPLELNFTKEEIHKPLGSGVSQFMGMLLLALSFFGCSESKSPSLALSVMADYTDTHIPKPDISVIQPIVKPIANQDGSCLFRYLPITHTSLNPSYEAVLPVRPRFGNSLEHAAKKKRFLKQVDGFLVATNDSIRQYSGSSILTPVVREFQQLSSSKAHQKLLLLYSDLQESSGVFNVYAQKQQRLLREAPEIVAEQIGAALDLPKSLNGITLHIIHYPKDAKDDALFKRMVSVWRLLFEPLGLKIHLGIAKPIVNGNNTIKSKSS